MTLSRPPFDGNLPSRDRFKTVTTKLAVLATRSHARPLKAVTLFLVASGCASLRIGRPFNRPAALVGEWVDLSHTSASDTALWILRNDGYDGTAHVLTTSDASGRVTIRRTEARVGSWYLDGNFADTAHHAICFARRLGRDGPTCMRFSFDTLQTAVGRLRHLVVQTYQGEHEMPNRELVERPRQEIPP
jgi:hypothetical protein